MKKTYFVNVRTRKRFRLIVLTASEDNVNIGTWAPNLKMCNDIDLSIVRSSWRHICSDLVALFTIPTESNNIFPRVEALWNDNFIDNFEIAESRLTISAAASVVLVDSFPTPRVFGAHWRETQSRLSLIAVHPSRDGVARPLRCPRAIDIHSVEIFPHALLSSPAKGRPAGEFERRLLKAIFGERFVCGAQPPRITSALHADEAWVRRGGDPSITTPI